MKKNIVIIKPIKFKDKISGDAVRTSCSPFYYTINNRTYYFKRENGEFDGTSTDF